MLPVRRSFNRAAASYRQAATAQAQVAERLAAMIDISICDKALEIGCGDGLFTERLGKEINIRSLIALDIANAPLRQLQPHVAQLHIQADGEKLPIRPGSIDLLVSSSTLQWFQQPEKSIPELLSCLRPDGSFFFSVFCRGTFAEMKQANQHCGFGEVYPLPNENKLFEIIQQSTCTKVTMETETITQTFSSVMQFLRSQQATGAGYSGNSKFCGKQALNQFIQTYAEKFEVNGEIPASYRIAYLHGRYNSTNKQLAKSTDR